MKIFLPAYNRDKFHQKYYNDLYVSGIEENGCVVVSTEEESDFIMLDEGHLDNYTIKYPDKTVMVDITDLPKLFDINVALYYKRSCVDKTTDTIINYPRTIIPFPLYIKKSYVDYTLNHEVHLSKIYDICCTHLDTSYAGKNNKNKDRTRILNYLISKQKSSRYKFYLNYNKKQIQVGRSALQEDYYKTMCRSKIIVNCNPDEWEGDYRLWESLASGSLVFCDKVLTPVDFPLIHKQHLIFYDRNNLNELDELIEYYLNNEEERKRISMSGYNFAMEHHTYKQRIGGVIEKMSSYLATLNNS
jgi:hypothetical protein